jgi:putative hydrolase of HD superfamily
MTVSAARAIVRLLPLAERLKRELRHSWLSNGRQESVAEHTWQMALLALLAAPHLNEKVDIGRVMKMIIVHDLVEAETGDIPFFEISQRKATKAQRESEAIGKIRSLIGGSCGEEVYELFREFEARRTRESRFAAALDALEAQAQHNLAPIRTWESVEYDLVYTKLVPVCTYDSFLAELCREIMSDATEKMEQAGIDVKVVRRRAEMSAAGAREFDEH